VHRPVLFRPRFERSLYVTAPSVMRNGAREGEWKVILLLRQGSDDPLVKIETPRSPHVRRPVRFSLPFFDHSLRVTAPVRYA